MKPTREARIEFLRALLSYVAGRARDVLEGDGKRLKRRHDSVYDAILLIEPLARSPK